MLNKLFERQILCLTSLLKISKQFMGRTETNNLEAVAEFKKQRQGLIHVLSQLDIEINKLNLQSQMKLPEVQKMLEQKRSLLKEILDCDSKILQNIASEKTDVIQKLGQVQSGKRTLSAYKSPSHSHRIGSQGLLDKEA